MRLGAVVRGDGAAFDRVVDVAGMRSLERAAPPERNLMRIAGRALAREVGRTLGPVQARRVVALIGPGDNGGDALIMARHLSEEGASVICWGARQRDDDLVRDARRAGVSWRVWSGDAAELANDVAPAACVVDGLLGIGSSPPLRGAVAQMLQALPAVRDQARYSVDIPTGTDGDTGAADADAFRATDTLATGPIKLGSLLHPAIEFAGRVRALDIELAAETLEELSLRLIDGRTVRGLLPARTPGGHKGTFGRVLIVGGSDRFRGAPTLAAIAAIGAGAGLVTVASVEPAVAAAAAAAPSATSLPLSTNADGCIDADADDLIQRAAPEVVLIGPGLGRSHTSDALAVALAHADVPTVIDADGLNALADRPDTLHELRRDAVLTPHPGELARLAGLDGAPDGTARLSAARELAERTRATVISKGSPTCVCADGLVWVLARPNPVLATAGTGDVLAGTLAGLLAQGAQPPAAAALAVWLLARAAELAAVGVDGGVPADAIGRAVWRARAEVFADS